MNYKPNLLAPIFRGDDMGKIVCPICKKITSVLYIQQAVNPYGCYDFTQAYMTQCYHWFYSFDKIERVEEE